MLEFQNIMKSTSRPKTIWPTWPTEQPEFLSSLLSKLLWHALHLMRQDREDNGI